MTLERQYEVKRFGVHATALSHLEGRVQEARRYRRRLPIDAGCRAIPGDYYSRLTASTCLLCDVVWATLEDERRLGSRKGVRR